MTAATFILLLLPLATGILPAGCAATLAGNPDHGAKDALKSARGRPGNAMAYEHYLKSQLLLSKSRRRDAVYELRQALVYDHGSAYLHTRLGELYAQEGLWRLARQESKEALSINPDHVPALLLRGKAERRAGKPPEAIKTYERVMALDRRSINAYIHLAEIFLETGQKERALRILEEMTAANPESALGFRRLAEFYFEQGNEKEAETHFRRVLEINPSDTDTVRTLTGLLEKQGHYQEAIQVFVEALETSPEFAPYMAYMARLHLKAGDKKSAHAYLDHLRTSDPSNASLIADVYLELNLYQEAIRELEAVLKQNPNANRERLLLAYLHEERKEWESALTQLKQISKTSRFHVNSQYHIGYCLKQLKKYPQATEVLRQTLDIAKKKSDLGRIHEILSKVYVARKMYKHGLRILNDAIRDHPDLTSLVEAKANLLFEAKRAREGVKTLKKALADKPRNVPLLYALGALYERMGRIEDSLRAMRKVLEVEPNNYSALNYIGYTLADLNRNLDEAERLIRRALLLAPGNGAITDSLGWILYRRAKYKEALEYLLRADSISPGESVITMHVGDAYLKLGQRGQAIEYYRRALKFNPEPHDLDELNKRLKDLGIPPTPVL
jgi:tetratricopeptide (TPR) repeat protein